jgi:hypothetical protein
MGEFARTPFTHALIECCAPRGASPRVPSSSSRGFGDQGRRERRLIQKAPADSATRTPIHPTKRSSEDRCIVSGSSTTMRVPTAVPDRTGGAIRQRTPRREPAVSRADLTAGALSHTFSSVAGRRSSRMRKRLTGFTVEVLHEVVLMRTEIGRVRQCPVEFAGNEEM